MSYAPMFETWRRTEDGATYDVVLDLGRGETYPLASYPWFFGVRVPMANKVESGQPARGEAARLDVVENRIRKLVLGRDGLYVGRLTGGGNRDLVFYMPERPRGLEDRIRASIGMEILFINRADPKWQGFEALLPSTREFRQIEDLRTISALLNANADPDRLHSVEHRVATSSKQGAAALVRFFDKLELEDVRVDRTPPRDRSADGPPEVTIVGVQKTPLDLDEIHRVSWILDSKAPKARGTYRGWSADPELREDDEQEAAIEALIAATDDIEIPDDELGPFAEAPEELDEPEEEEAPLASAEAEGAAGDPDEDT